MSNASAPTDAQRPTSASAGTVARAVRILRAVAESSGEVSIAAVAADLGLPRATVHRLLNLLVEEGMVAPVPERRTYEIGSELFRIAALVGNHLSLPRIARPVMERVVETCGETCMLGVYLPAQRHMMFADVVDSSHPLGYRIELLTPFSILWGASGRAILAFLPPEEIEAVLRVEGPSPAEGEPVPTLAELEQQLQPIRDRGYAFTEGQKIPDSRGIAAPIHDHSKVVGSLCLTIPSQRFVEGSETALAELVRRHAAELSATLGHS